VRIVLLLLIPLAFGFDGPQPAPLTARTPFKIVRSLRAIAAARAPCASLKGQYRDGNGTHGYTTVTIDTGQVTVQRTRAGKSVAEYTGKLPKEMCRAMPRNAVEGRLWRIKPRRETGVPDETKPQITMGAAGSGTFTVSTWDNDIQNQRVFAVARGQFITLATHISGGKVTY
jgi:hypothetical protein